MLLTGIQSSHDTSRNALIRLITLKGIALDLHVPEDGISNKSSWNKDGLLTIKDGTKEY